MRAMTITPDHRLQLAEVPEPVPAEGEVLIDVVAAGVNRADLLQVRGQYPPPPGASELPGLEVSGYRRDTGRPVVALLAGGGYAEQVAVPIGQVLPAPSRVDLVAAAGIPEVAATVVSNLVHEADPREGQSVLIEGGTGGIGSFAIPFARSLGAHVLTTVGSAAAVEMALALGAHEAYDRHTEDVTARVRATGGVDVILDVVGGPALSEHVSMLRENGRLVVIGTLGGARGEVDLSALMSRRARIIGTTIRSRSVREKTKILETTREMVWPLLRNRTLTVPVAARLPLERAAEAHEILRAGGHVGKVILTVQQH